MVNNHSTRLFGSAVLVLGLAAGACGGGSGSGSATNQADWQTVPSEPDANNPTAVPGIYAVKSSSDATAIDGTKYSDW